MKSAGKNPVAGPAERSAALVRTVVLCSLLASAIRLPSSVFAQGLFPSGGKKRDSIATAPQSLSSGATTRDSAARRSGGRPLPGPRPDTVQLPYNLMWGDTTGRLSSLIAGVGAKITNKKTDTTKETWSVEGIIAPNLQSSSFTFQSGQLSALEFDYGQAEWDQDKFNEQMGQFRRLLESKCQAPGEMISRGPTEPPAPDATVKETLTGYQWKHGDTIVQLFYFAAEDSAKKQNYRTISVHYHYTDPFASSAPPEDTAYAPAVADGPAPAVGAAAASADPATNPLPTDPTRPAPGVTVPPPRGSSKKPGGKPGTPMTPETDPLPEH